MGEKGVVVKWSVLNDDATYGSKPSLSFSHNKLYLPQSVSIPAPLLGKKEIKCTETQKDAKSLQGAKSKTKNKTKQKKREALPL